MLHAPLPGDQEIKHHLISRGRALRQHFLVKEEQKLRAGCASEESSQRRGINLYTVSSKKVLILGSIWPEPRASAASTRVLNIVQALLRAGFQVSFSADAKETSATSGLREMGVFCLRLPQNDQAFRSFVRQLQPDVAIFDRFTVEEKFSWQVREQCPDCLRVLDTVDLHFVRHARGRAFFAGEPAETWPEIRKWAEDKPCREIAAIYRSDLSLVVSDYEMRLLIEDAGVPARLLLLSRLTYDAPPAVVPSFHERAGYVMIGSFRHPPNEDSVYWTQKQLWPAIRKIDRGASIHVYGSHAQKKHLQLSAPATGFHVKGYAEDACHLMAKSRINLAPLRFGAGIKGKIADGWWSGTPVVTTPIGAEGMHQGLPFGGIVTRTVKELAEAAVHLYHDQPSWEKFSAQGRAIMGELYTWRATMDPFVERLSWLLENRTTERLQNFTGAMLWQTGMRATEYFSRWIEAKQTSKSAPLT